MVLLLLAGQSGEKNKNGIMDLGSFLPGLSGSGSSGSGLPFSGISLPPIPLDSFKRDMHKIVDMMDQMESIGQMAGLSHMIGGPPSHIEGAADSVAKAVSSAGIPGLPGISGLPNMANLPDMAQLMEMAGPFMAMMQGQKK